ncbi:MAG: hypothetical protein LBU07_00830 [Coriobacteriales bacterium]|jgi:glutamate--cysteine ligase|nr:hypothetical protein [Coriobacteriales bacterium]
MELLWEQSKAAHSIASYLDAAARAQPTDSLGFELEHFVVTKGEHAAVPYASATEGQPGVEQVLRALAPYYTQQIQEVGTDAKVHLFGLARDKTVITLEPGSQLEVSVGPLRQIAELEEYYRRFRDELDAVLEPLGLEIATFGYHPSARARDLTLLPKQRYFFMDKHFAQTGNHGICMMRATASTQISVDYFSEADAVLKMRVATALGPLLAFVTDNTPVFEGQAVGQVAKGHAHHPLSPDKAQAMPARMARMVCWDDTDPERSLVAPGTFDEDFGFARYAADLLRAPAIFTPALSNEEPAYRGFCSFANLLPDADLSEAAILHILSMFFYDTRLKSYVEIRQADAMPLTYTLALVALIKGVFYNPAALSYYEKRFEFMDSAQVAFAKTALRMHGYQALVYRRPASQWLDELLRWAQDGLSANERHYLRPLADLITSRQTLLHLI